MHAEARAIEVAGVAAPRWREGATVRIANASELLLKVAVLSLFLFSREKDVQKGKSNTSFVALDVPKISK